MRIERASSDCAVPDWPQAADPTVYPRRPGMLRDWGLGQDVNRSAKSGNSSAGFVTVGPSILHHRRLPDILSRVPIPSRLPSCYTQAPKYAISSTMTWKHSFGSDGLYALTSMAPSTIVASGRRPPYQVSPSNFISRSQQVPL